VEINETLEEFIQLSNVLFHKKRTMSYCYSSHVDGLLLIRCNIERLEKIDKILTDTFEMILF